MLDKAAWRQCNCNVAIVECLHFSRETRQRLAQTDFHFHQKLAAWRREISGEGRALIGQILPFRVKTSCSASRRTKMTSPGSTPGSSSA